MNGQELREAFLQFFESKGHRRMPGAPIVPPGDPTLLFTSAGMVQFKPYFMGQASAPHPRVTTLQKCFRTSDIEEVGDTSHLTFFEMLGNFSFGDYFKAEAISWAWEFVTQRLHLEQDRLWAAVFLDDDEAHDLWLKTGVPAARIRRYGEEDNYWFSGEVGPCGPCSELYYDFGEAFGCGPGCELVHDCGRFLEIWNLVFMTYYRDGDKRTPLPAKNIDTGFGLERVSSVLLFQSGEWDRAMLPSVYDTGLFRPVLGRVEELSGKVYGRDPEVDRAMRVLAEHGRAVTFLVGDERTPVVPSNEERGYVARRMLRRALYFARHGLGIEGPVMTAVADAVIETMRDAYPELERQRKFVMDILAPEERRFDETLSRGIEMLERLMERSAGEKTVSGEDAFVLHDTYGFPVELTREIAARNGFKVDESGFAMEMERQRERARAATGGAGAVAADALYGSLVAEPTLFSGYDGLEARSRVVALVSANGELTPVNSATAPGRVEVFLEVTPFYPEGGGQVGDRGELTGPAGRVVVEDTQRVAERLIVHRGYVAEGTVAAAEEVTARVDPEHRLDTMRNHTATHLLHAALRSVLGTHVRQSGSLVAPGYLRFDFTHTEPLTQDEVAEVERLVNAKIRQNLEVHTRTTTFDQAMAEGVLAFFGDKYGEQVRVVEVNTILPRFSAELCGGTHCQRTGDVGLFLITGESSIGSGIRRIEALTGRGAEEHARQQRDLIDELARRLGTQRTALIQRVDAIVEEQDQLRKRIEKLERSLASGGASPDLLREATRLDGITVVSRRVDAPSIDALRYMADSVRKQLDSGVAVLGSIVDGRPFFVAIVTPDVVERGPRAGELLKRVASVTGGGGGGRPDMAQGGGKDASKLDAALETVLDAVREMLAEGGG